MPADRPAPPAPPVLVWTREAPTEADARFAATLDELTRRVMTACAVPAVLLGGPPGTIHNEPLTDGGVLIRCVWRGSGPIPMPKEAM